MPITKGPWTLVQHTGMEKITPGDDWTVRGPDGIGICFEGSSKDPNAAANAQAIAALPELVEVLTMTEAWLTACLECKEWHWDGDQCEAATEAATRARALLARLEGE